MSYKLSRTSLSRLEGVHTDLITVVNYAIKNSQVDFMVLEGLRSRERQAKLVKSGASQTMNSRHLTGHAVDLGAIVDGQLRWDWPLYYKIADAMIDAAGELRVPLVWGGAWHQRRADDWLGYAEDLSLQYVELRRSQGRKPFLDGPHFELPREDYR